MDSYPGRLIAILYRKSQIYWGQALKEYDISSAEYPILILLNKQDGITQEEIASRLYIDKSAVTRVIQSLQEKQFLDRKKDEEDRRCNRIYLTQKGRNCKAPIEQVVLEWNRVLTRNMDGQEQEKVKKLLEQMMNNAIE